jgi:hypothetical protein
MSKFAIRTIQSGTVTINGKVYRPDENFMPYDGRLDGLRYAFGLYEDEPFVSLWGTEKSYHEPENYKTGREVVMGRLVWQWWRE